MSNELRDALAARQPTDDRPEGAVRVVELCKQLGWSDHRVRDHIRDLLEAGEAERVGISIEGLDGRRMNVVAYRLKRAA
jgi:predicted ArsR family transcriptional regulator